MAEQHAEHDERAHLTVTVTSPAGVLFQGKADEVTAPGRNGVLGILPQHTRLISLLREGDLVIKNTRGDEKIIPITHGFIEVNRTTVSVLISTLPSAAVAGAKSAT